MDGTHRTAYDQSGQIKDGIGRKIPHSAVVDDIDRIDVTGRVGFQSRNDPAGIFGVVGVVGILGERGKSIVLFRILLILKGAGSF